MYESRTDPPISRRRFADRLALHVAIAAVILVASLALGMAGYELFEGLGWRDAFLNAAMLLGGMGPVHAPKSDAGKLFAGCYALYAGLVFLVTASIMLAPVVHRVLHQFHWTGK
jgi:hypothetical protein